MFGTKKSKETLERLSDLSEACAFNSKNLVVLENNFKLKVEQAEQDYTNLSRKFIALEEKLKKFESIQADLDRLESKINILQGIVAQDEVNQKVLNLVAQVKKTLSHFEEAAQTEF
jgi:uncharacterized protein YlxW (UPF0749 family)